MNECECDIPTGGERICGECGLFLSRSTEEIGRLHTKLDAALVALDLDEVELRQFVRKLNDTVSVDTRHKYGTWQHNRRARARGLSA